MTKWVNRIIGHGEESPEQLTANPRNWRIHPRYQQEALKGAIADVGFIRSVTVNQRTGFVLDGHLRVWIALEEGQTTVPVEYVDIPEELEAEALATFDPIAALATPDQEKLNDLIRDVSTESGSIEHMLANMQRQGKSLMDMLEEDEDNPEDEEGAGQLNQQRYPLPIVLDQPGYRRWVHYKHESGIRSDTQAFLAMLEQVEG